MKSLRFAKASTIVAGFKISQVSNDLIVPFILVVYVIQTLVQVVCSFGLVENSHCKRLILEYVSLSDGKTRTYVRAHKLFVELNISIIYCGNEREQFKFGPIV
jgi:hypothetical protein